MKIYLEKDEAEKVWEALKYKDIKLMIGEYAFKLRNNSSQLNCNSFDRYYLDLNLIHIKN